MMMRFLYPLCLMLPLAACTSTYVEDLASEDFAPVYPADGLQDQGGLPTGGIYSASSAGLFASDRRAARVGDILTVQFAERFSASKSQTASGSSQSEFAADLPNLFTGGVPPLKWSTHWDMTIPLFWRTRRWLESERSRKTLF